MQVILVGVLVAVYTGGGPGVGFAPWICRFVAIKAMRKNEREWNKENYSQSDAFSFIHYFGDDDL